MPSSHVIYDWIREVKPELTALDAIPLTGNVPSFPWDQLSSRLAQAFERDSISITPKQIEWRSQEQLYEGLGDSPYPLYFAIPSLQGTVCWVMPEQEMATLESLLLTKEPHPISFQDRELSEAFYRFLALEVLFHMSQIDFDKSIAPVLMNQANLPQEDALCLDIAMTIQGQILWGRLIISSDFRRSWVEHFAHRKQSSPLEQKLAHIIEMVVEFEVGKIHLSLKEWSQVALGDYLLLDHCSLEPDTFSGRLSLTVNGKQAFRGKLKDGNIKILEFPLYHEVDTPMAKNHEEEEDEDDFTEDLTDLDFDEDEDFFREDEDETLETEEKPSTAQATVASKPAAAEKKTEEAHPTSVQTEKKHVPISPKEITMNISVEVGRIQMALDKLLALEPGNLLELNIRPEDGVSLVANGKIIGRGELIRIGETIGVRILELG